MWLEDYNTPIWELAKSHLTRCRTLSFAVYNVEQLEVLFPLRELMPWLTSLNITLRGASPPREMQILSPGHFLCEHQVG